MDRLFRIDFYPQEWIVQTGRLNLEQRGLYIQICALIYANRGPIDNDPAWIARSSGCSPRLARSVISQLVGMDFLQFRGSKVTQKRCERELNLKRTHLENSSKGGRTRHENRDETSKNNDLGSSDDPISVSTPSPTATAKAKENSRDDSRDLFETFWLRFPRQRRGDRKKAMASWKRKVKEGTDPQTILDGLAAYLTSRDVAEGFACGATVWLNNSAWENEPIQAANQGASGTGRKLSTPGLV